MKNKGNKNHNGLIILFLCISTVLVNPAYGLTINQDSWTNMFQIQYFEPLGQSFTATDTDIASVGLFIRHVNEHLNYNDHSLTITLFNGAGDFSLTSQLATNNFAVLNGNDYWLDLDVSDVSFVQDGVYTIGVFNDTPQWGVDVNDQTNPYDGGRAYWNPGGSNNIQPEIADLRFRVTPNNSSPVPEPSTMFLFGLGILSLAGVNRKKIVSN